MKHIVFIGGGNMGAALVAGLLASQQWKPSEITVTDKRPDVLAPLKKKYKVNVSDDNQKSVGKATVVLLAVKPQQMRLVLEDIGPLLRPRQLVLSIAAGIPCAQIESFLAPHVPVIRVMPNTPALVGSGMAAIAAGRSAKPAHLKTAERILATVGKAVRVREKDMDAVTAVSGSGPAYVFYVAEAMKDAARALGLAPETADLLVRQTILGAGQLLAASPEEPQELRRRVTSPGGTTEAALGIMDEGRLKSLFAKALARAAERSQELSRGGL